MRLREKDAIFYTFADKNLTSYSLKMYIRTESDLSIIQVFKLLYKHSEVDSTSFLSFVD